jgi:cell wall-associated NlpC family hydrolase
MNEELREKIVRLALLQHNKKYVHGKNGPETFDCAGLVWHVYKELMDINVYKDGIGISTTTKIMTNPLGELVLYDEASEDKDLSIIKPGDILLFHRQSLDDHEPKPDNKYPGHCGIYIGEGKFIHALRKSGKVVISDFNRKEYWKKVLVGYKNIVDKEKTIKR